MALEEPLKPSIPSLPLNTVHITTIITGASSKHPILIVDCTPIRPAAINAAVDFAIVDENDDGLVFVGWVPHFDEDLVGELVAVDGRALAGAALVAVGVDEGPSGG